ncbi:MAG TPA: DUF664 domain-containing protein [Acidimicrobiia bacterium]|nr:DUF664 domain-containing protein [Acidimicrobiia bacterium]
MQVNDTLCELFGRIAPLVGEVVDGLDEEALTAAPAGVGNPVGGLVWHLTRVQDHHVAELLGEAQVWESGDWAKRFGLAPDPSNTGYGHSAEEVAAVRPESADVLIEYHAAVATRTLAYLRTLAPDDLDRIVDRRWDPPVTLGVRLVSIADDDLQHVGQAAYARGVLDR